MLWHYIIKRISGPLESKTLSDLQTSITSPLKNSFSSPTRLRQGLLYTMQSSISYFFDALIYSANFALLSLLDLLFLFFYDRFVIGSSIWLSDLVFAKLVRLFLAPIAYWVFLIFYIIMWIFSFFLCFVKFWSFIWWVFINILLPLMFML